MLEVAPFRLRHDAEHMESLVKQGLVAGEYVQVAKDFRDVANHMVRVGESHIHCMNSTSCMSCPTPRYGASWAVYIYLHMNLSKLRVSTEPCPSLWFIWACAYIWCHSPAGNGRFHSSMDGHCLTEAQADTRGKSSGGHGICQDIVPCCLSSRSCVNVRLNSARLPHFFPHL